MHMGGAGNNFGSEIEVADNGTVFVSAKMAGSNVLLDGTGREHRYQAQGELEGMLVVLDSQGGLLATQRPKDNQWSSGGAIAINARGDKVAQVYKFRGSLGFGRDQVSTSGRSDKDFAIVMMQWR
jgi:hypothetical protein